MKYESSPVEPNVGREGAAPDGWSLVRLGEIFDQIVDSGHTEDLPVLSVTLDKGVVRRSSLERRSERAVERRQYLRVLPGDIAYNTMRMWQGGSGLVREEGYLSPAYTVCRPRQNESPLFWAQAFKSRQMIRAFRAHSQGFAKDRYRLYFQHFASVFTLRPPFAEQTKIASILSSVDETIEDTTVVIGALQKIRKILLGQLFNSEAFDEEPDPRRQLPRKAAGWRISRLDEVSQIQTGIAKGKPKVDHTAEIPYLRVANVQDGFLDLGEMKTLKVAPEAVERYALREGDVLFTEGGDADKLGRGCVWRGEVNPCLHQNHVFVVRVARDVLVPEFLSYFGSSPAGKAYFMSCAKQTTNLASINSSQLRAMPVPIPSLAEQRRIVDVISSVGARIEAEREVRKSLCALKSPLSNALLTGQLRVVSDDEAPS